MTDDALVAGHYTHGALLEAIRAGVKKLGKTTATISVEDLAPVDEFHIGGRVATESFLSQLDISRQHHVLDVGCGLGGGSRFAAHHYGCHVTGIDLTQEYVDAGTELCNWVGLSDQVSLRQGDATASEYQDQLFDRAFMMHVGMNIADKKSLARELFRVVVPGGRVGIYDVMGVGDGDLVFPVPWAMSPQGSAVSSAAEYKSALEDAGFRITGERNRRDFALQFFHRLTAQAANTQGPPALGLHILMGETAPVKIRNMVENISRHLIAPLEIPPVF